MAMLISNTPLHLLDSPYFVIAKVKQRCVGIGGYGLEKVEKYPCLIRAIIYPKRLVEFGRVGYN